MLTKQISTKHEYYSFLQYKFLSYNIYLLLIINSQNAGGNHGKNNAEWISYSY